MATKNSKQSKLVLKFGKDNGDPVVVSWSEADSRLVIRLIDVCNRAGCAPSFAVTLDGGAYRIYFLHEAIAQRDRSKYLPGTGDVDTWLVEWIEFWESVIDEQKLS